jgi:ribosome-binding factor A
VRERLSTLLARDISDPLLTGVIITAVELPDDLSVAHVKARLLIGGDDEKKRAIAIRSLSRVANRLRKNLGSALGLRRVPELRFAYDTGIDARERVEVLLAEIDADAKADSKKR